MWKSFEYLAEALWLSRLYSKPFAQLTMYFFSLSHITRPKCCLKNSTPTYSDAYVVLYVQHTQSMQRENVTRISIVQSINVYITVYVYRFCYAMHCTIHRKAQHVAHAIQLGTKCGMLVDNPSTKWCYFVLLLLLLTESFSTAYCGKTKQIQPRGPSSSPKPSMKMLENILHSMRFTFVGDCDANHSEKEFRWWHRWKTWIQIEIPVSVQSHVRRC